MYLEDRRRCRCLAAVVGLFLLAGAARAGIGCWDLFSVGLFDDYYWNKVDGCSGTLLDELFIPPGPPDGAPLITTTSKLGGIMYAFGGHDWNWGEDGGADLEYDGGGYSIIGAQPYLSVVLDTATVCNADDLFPSWGDFLNINVYMDDGAGGWLPLEPDIHFTWVRSHCDINSMLTRPSQFATNIRLATDDFSDQNTWWSHGWPEIETQDAAVYGFGARLPSAAQYRVDFVSDVYTWDSYNTCRGPRIPEPAPVLVLGIAGLMLAGCRRSRS